MTYVAPEHRRLDGWIEHADAVLGAFVEGRLVGFAARYHSPLHPVRDWVTVHVEPRRRRTGIGFKLHRSLLAAGDGRPSKVRMPSTEEAGLRFAAARGYSHLVSSAEVILHHVPSPMPATAHEIVKVAIDDKSFLIALGRLYVATHRWDPCSGIDFRDVRRLLAGDDALADTARIVQRSGEVVGVGLAYEGLAPNRIELATIGAVDPEAEDGVAITHAVLHAVSHPVLEAGATVVVECDFGPGANTALSAVLTRLVGEPATTLDTVEILATTAS